MEGFFLLAVAAVVIAVGLVIYFWPTLVAKGREHHNLAAIFMLNLLLGWTLLGWVAAMVWAYTKPEKAEPAAAPFMPVTPAAAPRIQPEQERLCPHCAETVKMAALVCKHCGRDLPAVPPPAPVSDEEKARRLGIVHSPEFGRYLWRRQFFSSLPEAIEYAERNS